MSDPEHSEAAIDWLIRQRDPAFTAWDAFSDWLEADPRNAEAYAQLAARDEALSERLADSRADAAFDAPAAAEIYSAPEQRGWFSRRGAIGGITAIAASIALAFGIFQLAPEPSLYQVATAPGVQQTITLAGGTSIALNGGTRLTLDRNDPRFAILERGEAKFTVAHHPSDPFRVRVGGAELLDLGTVFNVLHDDKTLHVGVAEGIVMYNPQAEAIELPPGRALRVSQGGERITLSRVAPSTVGSWQEGRLTYEGAPLEQVARDLSRNLGIDVTADPAVAARPVTAVVQLSGDREQLARRLERLLGIRVRESGQDWTLTDGV